MNREIASYIDRLVSLEKEKARIAEDESDIKKEAKSRGYDPTLIMKCVRLRLKDETKRRKELDQIELFDTYLAAAGLISDRDEGVVSKPRGIGPKSTAAVEKTVVTSAEGITVELVDAGPRHVVAFVTEAPIQTPAREEHAGLESREGEGATAPTSEASAEAATIGKGPSAPGANSGNDIDDDGIPGFLRRPPPVRAVVPA